jgi:type IV pilus assembly protein PilC
MQKFFSRSETRGSLDFLKRLSIFLNAGLPLSISLDGASSNAVQRDFAEKVKAGASFSSSLSILNIPGNITGMIAVGEKSGDLASSVSAACAYMGKNVSFRKKLLSSMIYPAFVLIVCFAALIVLSAVLVPAFSSIYESQGIELPFISRLVIATMAHMNIILIVFVVIGALAVRYIAGDRGLELPISGSIRKKLLAAGIFRTMAEGLGAGMNLIDSLNLCLNITGSSAIRSKIIEASSKVNAGAPLSASLAGTGIFSSTAISLIGAGEAASSLVPVFRQLSAMYEEELENMFKAAAGLAEPLSTLACGVVVGIIVLAMFMPIVKLMGVIGG